MIDPAAPKPPQSAYAVLGLLASAGEQSGYDLKRLADDSLRFFFRLTQSQVYTELRRLTERGCVSTRDIVQQGRPDKRLHRITPAGEKLLNAWLSDAQAVPTAVTHPVLLRLFFGHLADRDGMRRMLEQYAEINDAILRDLDAVAHRLEQFGDVTFPGIIAEWGVSVYTNERNAIAHALERLDELDGR